MESVATQALTATDSHEEFEIDSKHYLQGLKYPNITPLSVKKSLEFLLAGRLKTEVCRFCLNVTAPLIGLERVFDLALPPGELHSLSVRQMIAHVHPFKLTEDPNFPCKICDVCLDSTITSYLFIVRCERSERALRNCLDDIYEKLNKLDPLEPRRKRGRHKEHPNHNIIKTEHENVSDYAKPVTNIVNSTPCTVNTDVKSIVCGRCWQEFPSREELIVHERLHPKTMWYNCKTCGNSFPKQMSYRKHIKECIHVNNPSTDPFKCNICSETNESYLKHLQHVEKHKFKDLFEHLLDRTIDRLCAVCFDKDKKMIDMENEVFLHGGCPELVGSRNLYDILRATIPQISTPNNVTSSKICVNCLDHAITSYVFINKSTYVRKRIDSCLTNILSGLNIEPSCNVFVEIPDSSILPITHQEDLSVEILEDEFRIESSGESDVDVKKESDVDVKKEVSNLVVPKVEKVLPTMVNGFHSEKDNICSEFLSFKKKTKGKCDLSCPVCSKCFINKYFLKKHVKRHTNKKVECLECNVTFKSVFSLNEHVKKRHVLQITSFETCKICDRTFSSIKKLRDHNRVHRKNQCVLCDKFFKSQTCYNSHIQRHALKFNIARNRSKHTCSFCEKEYLNNNELLYHVNKNHLQIKSFACNMCEKHFYTQSDYLSHRKVHNQYCREKCEVCNKILRSRSKLLAHVQKHLGYKPFTCMLCNESFYSEFKLKQHVRSAHGGMFNCSLCKSVFSDQFSLKCHSYTAHSIF